MKSKICMIIVLIIFLALTVTSLKSIASTTANIVVDSKNVVLGSEVDVSIDLKNNMEFSAANFVLTYDNSVLEYKGYTVGNVLKKSDGSTNGMLVLNENASGKIGIGYISDTTQTTETKNAGNLLKFKFNVKSGEGTSTNINLEATTLKKDDGTDVVANITNGKLTIISGIKMTSASLNLKMGTTSTLAVETLPVLVDITKETITWNSANTSVAKVSSNGLVTPVAPGTTEITATVLGLKAKCTVTVTAPLQSISLSKQTVTLYEGDTTTLEVTYNPTNTTDSKAVTWNSSNKNVATIDTNGKITAISHGETVITAIVGNKTATCNLTVKMLGDIDEDDEITAFDAYKALEASVDILLGEDVNERSFLILDVDKDEKVTAQDAYKILQRSVGIIDEF